MMNMAPTATYGYHSDTITMTVYATMYTMNIVLRVCSLNSSGSSLTRYHPQHVSGPVLKIDGFAVLFAGVAVLLVRRPQSLGELGSHTVTGRVSVRPVY